MWLRIHVEVNRGLNKHAWEELVEYYFIRRPEEIEYWVSDFISIAPSNHLKVNKHGCSIKSLISIAAIVPSATATD